MSKSNYLFLRDGRYYFRARLPAELVQALGKKELKRSLGTKSLTEAIKRSRPLVALISQLRTMSDSEKIFRQLHNIGLSPDKLTHKIGSISKSKAGYVIKDVDVNPASPEDVKALLAVIDALGAADEERLTKAPASSILLSQAVDAYIAHYTTLNNPPMLKKVKSVVKVLFIAIVGDKPINELKKQDLSKFFDEAQKLPPTWISSHLKGLSIAAIIEGNEKARLSLSTLKTPYKAAINGFLAWSFDRYKDIGFPEITITKHDITYLGETDEDGGNGQRAFKPDELRRLFECPETLKLANDWQNVHRYWLILVGLHTGARVREICQLNPITDIKEIGGVYCFCFQKISKEDDKSTADPEVVKSLKNKGSKRNVPIHPRLIDLGFLEYVKCLVEADARRFSPLFSVKNGNAGAEAGRQLIRYLKALNLRDETPGARIAGFHAFRHTFISYAHNYDIPNYWELSGHDDKNVPESAKIYRDDKDAPKLLELVE